MLAADSLLQVDIILDASMPLKDSHDLRWVENCPPLLRDLPV